MLFWGCFQFPFLCLDLTTTRFWLFLYTIFFFMFFRLHLISFDFISFLSLSKCFWKKFVFPLHSLSRYTNYTLLDWAGCCCNKLYHFFSFSLFTFPPFSNFFAAAAAVATSSSTPGCVWGCVNSRDSGCRTLLGKKSMGRIVVATTTAFYQSHLCDFFMCAFLGQSRIDLDLCRETQSRVQGVSQWVLPKCAPKNLFLFISVANVSKLIYDYLCCNEAKRRPAVVQEKPVHGPLGDRRSAPVPAYVWCGGATAIAAAVAAPACNCDGREGWTNEQLLGCNDEKW